jgi:hypothetical protein
MGILDFFKSKEQNLKKEKIEFKDISRWIIERREKERMKEIKAITNIKEIISELSLELSEKKEAFKSINIREKREHEKIKEVVIQNLEIYKDALDSFTQNLNYIEGEQLEVFMSNLNKIVLDFEKRSKVPFERATILIGKELAGVKEVMSDFFKNINSLFENNKLIISSLNILKIAENELQELKNLIKEKEGILESQKVLESRRTNLKLEEESLEKKLDKEKNSINYLNDQKSKEEATFRKKHLEKKILNLRTNIDFKSLESVHHRNEKQMKIIKNCENDFNGLIDGTHEDFLSLLEDAKGEIVRKEIEEITKEGKEIEEILQRKNLLESFEVEKMKIALKLKEIDSELLKNSKRLNKIQEESTIKEKIAKQLDSMDLEVVFS